MGPIPDLESRAAACAARLRDAESVLLASHIDADGLTSAAIAATALERAGIPFETVFAKQLDADAIDAIAATDHEVALFTDFGSGQLDDIAAHAAAGAFAPVVADHHQPADAEIAHHLNPLLVGIDGAAELSGAGTTYALARALAEGEEASGGGDDAVADRERHRNNRDLAALAVVGAVGDMQASGGELVGANRQVVAEGVAAGVLEEATDLALYGRQTRPLPKLLEYASEVRIPGISGSERGAVGFLSDLDLDLRAGSEWRHWADLNADERRTVASALLQRALARGVPADRAEDLIGTTYVLAEEPAGTELRDVSEFSTLLNATARYDRADVGLAVCRGDRGDALGEARRLLSNHRRNLSEGLEWVQSAGTTREDNIQWFDAGDRIRETIVGIVAGMALGTSGIDGNVPIVAFAHADAAEATTDATAADTTEMDGMTADTLEADTLNEDATSAATAEADGGEPSPGDRAGDPAPETKVSARGTHRLVREGLDLSAVTSEASAAVGGGGGGHDVAAGATIPRGTEAAFVERADAIVGEQLE